MRPIGLSHHHMEGQVELAHSAKIEGHTTYDARTFWAGKRRAEAERTCHQAPRATQTVRHLCGSSTDGQTAFSDRHASYGGPRSKFIGRLGAELDVEAGRKAAHLAALNVLAVARQHLGSLDKVTRIVRLGVAVATSGDVRDQPKVADAASELLQEVFGKEKNPCRLVYGVASLPLGVPIELEIIFEVG